MSIKSLLMPAISQRLLSRERLLSQRRKAEWARVARGERHTVLYFHQVDDPYSALAAASLPQLAQRYDINLLAHVVGPPPDSAAPDRDRLIAYSRKDAQLLAQRWGLEFRDPGSQPTAQAIGAAGAELVGAIKAGTFVRAAAGISARLWNDSPLPVSTMPFHNASAADAVTVSQHTATANALRQALGHYLGATFYYAGEWYWGIDRLYHLERRLQELGAQRDGVQGVLYPPAPDPVDAIAPARPATVDFFFSLRSPYSAIVAPRVQDLARHTGAQINLRYVLPMVMRGLAVPREKRSYIALDAAREAAARGIAFGRINDPVGRPTERGLALMPLAQRQGKGWAYLLSFMNGVWAHGIDAGSDRGLRRIAEGGGLDWREAQAAMQDDAWRATAEANRQEMLGLGLWGVPSFRVRDTAVWGQDRLWAVQDALLEP